MKNNRFLPVAFAALSLVVLLASSNKVLASNTNGIVITSKFMLCPAPTSAANSICLGNQIQYVLNGWTPNYISVDPNDPTALSLYNTDILRPSQASYGPASFVIHDCTNNPTGLLANENGGRFDFLNEIRSTNDTLFLASQGSFQIRSTDANNNTWAYSGNLATNTVAGGGPLVFSDQYRGYVMSGTNPIPVAYYHSGESVTNMITRLIVIIRDGYYVQNTNAIATVLSYTAAVMDYNVYFSITIGDVSVTNVVGTQVMLSPVVSRNNTSTTVYVEGQHGIPTVNYGLQSTTNLAPVAVSLGSNTNTPWRTAWTTVASGLSDGYVTVTSVDPTNTFYRGSELPVSHPNVQAHSTFLAPVSLPKRVVTIGME